MYWAVQFLEGCIQYAMSKGSEYQYFLSKLSSNVCNINKFNTSYELFFSNEL